jgi:hypothetical protein
MASPSPLSGDSGNFALPGQLNLDLTPFDRADIEVGKYYLKTAARRINHNLAALWSNDDDDTTAIANRVIAG